ncbi:MAG: hypothetical protein Q8K02_15060, partial [Flavobacterium sp.]|nr:hypothetical protein [Flavobacterium sp.]
MKTNFIINTSQEFFCNWIRDFTLDASQRDFPTEKGYISLQQARLHQKGYSGSFYMCMHGHYVTPPIGDAQTAYPIDSVIEFKIIPLDQNRIEIFSECSQSVVESYYIFILEEISKRWIQIQGSEKQISEIQQAVMNSLIEIQQSQKTLINIEEKISKVIEAIHNGQMKQGEMIRTLDAIRRALKYLQKEKLNLSDNDKGHINQSNEIINSKIDIQQKIELTLPILPLFLK